MTSGLLNSMFNFPFVIVFVVVVCISSVFAVVVPFFVVYCVLFEFWFSSLSFWLLTQRSQVRFPALPDFLSSSGSERGPLSPCEDK
jgi:hypothetical protein